MSSPQTTPTSELAAVASAVRDNDRFLLVTHENPDGDALGSILAMQLALEHLGKDSVMYLPGDTDVPTDYEFMRLQALRRELPADAGGRVLLALDCATAQRMGVAENLLEQTPLSIDVDHHHDNTRFGSLNLVVAGASSTGEIVRDILRDLDVPLTPAIAEAIFVALDTDTGGFHYRNTTAKAFRLGAELVEAGVDVSHIFQQIYENIPLAKAKLLARALDRLAVYEGGRLAITYLLREDFNALGVGEEYAEGIINSVRSIAGVEMAATIREPPEPPEAERRISMRSSHDELDVSAIARKRGGGGHRQAAGFSTDESIDEIVEFLRQEFAAASARAHS